ncbi:MAG TPA: hypothetical protein VFA32_21830 [Dehalococcoidia bacterium]|nr:hypothetical protein [Dehalococcoidia bacterium]
MSDRAQLVLQEQVDQETSELRQCAQVALDRWGELDTPEKQEIARRIRAGLEDQIHSVRERLSHQSRDSYNEAFDQEAEELRRQAQTALRELGRVDSLEKVERARQVRARLEDDINRLKRERSHRLRQSAEQRMELGTDTRSNQVRNALTDRARDNLRSDLQEQRDRAGEIRDRAADAVRQNQEQRDRLQAQARQVVRQNADSTDAQTRPESRPAAKTPTTTPEPEVADERTMLEDTTSDSNADRESREGGSGSRP